MGIGNLLKGVVGGIVIIAAICITWPLQMIAVDGLYKQFVEHCTVDGQEFTRLYARSSTAGEEEMISLDGYIQLIYSTTGTKCIGSTAALASVGNWAFVGTDTLFTVGGDLYSEHNEKVQSAKVSVETAGDATAKLVITNAKVKQPIPIVKPYSNISLTVLGAIPVIGVISFLTMASVNFYRNQSMGGSDEIGKNIMWTIGGLIIMVVQMFAAPLVIGFINFAYVASGGSNISGGPFQAMETFGDVIQIGFEFSPLLYILSMLGTLGYAGFRSFKDDIRGFAGRSGMM